MKMQMSENDLERALIKKSPVYIRFLFIVSARAFLGISLVTTRDLFVAPIKIKVL